MLISIVIPTRERAQYLLHSLATVTSIQDADIEIVVSDNASKDHTREVVEAANDPRIVYLQTPGRVSMRMNFEFAFNNTKGDYVICFGDDDGILPGQFPLLRRLLADRRPDGVSWSLPVYGWPIPGYGTKVGGVRFSASQSYGPVRRVTDGEARSVLASGRMDAFDVLPRIYHGAMSRALLDRIRRKDGILFGARSPDIYASFRAVLLGGTFDFINHPFTINGHSPSSTGGSMNGIGDKKKPGASDTRFITELAVDPVDDIVPLTKSMALAFLGTAQTAAACDPALPFQPDLRNWYQASLRDKRKKDTETAAEIDASIAAHARNFHGEDKLRAAQSTSTIDWHRTLAKLRAGLSKLNKNSSIRLVAEQDGQNTIATAAALCDAIFAEDASAAIYGGMRKSEAWARTLVRAKAFTREI